MKNIIDGILEAFGLYTFDTLVEERGKFLKMGSETERFFRRLAEIQRDEARAERDAALVRLSLLPPKPRIRLKVR